MKYILIKGTYHIVGQSPDADSVKFRAANPALWAQVETDNRAVFERALAADGGVVTLRLQGVDALETHFSTAPLALPPDLAGRTSTTLRPPPPLSVKQPAALAQFATDTLLGLIGATEVKWRTAGSNRFITEARIGGAVVKQKLADALPGYVVVGDVEQNGRPISWLFAGTTRLADGRAMSTADLVKLVDQSVNVQLMRQGLIYPLYFMTLAARLRDRLTAAVNEAQTAAAQAVPAGATPPPSLWRIDASQKGVALTHLAAVTTENALFPYLFRRVVRYVYARQMSAYWAALRANAAAIAPADEFNLAGFFDETNPYVFVISDQDFVRLSDVVSIQKNVLRMLKSPQDIVFLS